MSDTQQLINCKPFTAGLDAKELPTTTFLLLVADMLQRRASGIGTGELPEIEDLEPCDIEQANADGYCVGVAFTPAFDIRDSHIKAIILTQLNAFLCT